MIALNIPKSRSKSANISSAFNPMAEDISPQWKKHIANEDLLFFCRFLSNYHPKKN